jgi:hypothetical protein
MQAFFNDNPAADNFGRVKDQLAEVKDVMVDNIGERGVRRHLRAMTCCGDPGLAGMWRPTGWQVAVPAVCAIDDAGSRRFSSAERVLARGEKIELLVDKSEALNDSAKKFQRSSRALKNVMWWKNVKMWLLIIAIVAVLIWLISSFVCGFDYSKCKGS